MSDQGDLINRLPRSLDPVDREPFRQAAEAALAASPVELRGERSVRPRHQSGVAPSARMRRRASLAG
jgi:hypothetical protein